MVPRRLKTLRVFIVGLIVMHSGTARAQDNINRSGATTSIIKLWPDEAPQWDAPEQAERDTTTPESNLVGGERVIRLTDVSAPELHIFPAKGDHPSKTVVIVCPGGGYKILAWDLEGTEIGQWLQGIGVTAAVCKYRVPSSKESDDYWKPAVQDIQRSISLIRNGAAGWKPRFVGTIGFSAGGNASARAALATERFYARVDSSEDTKPTPDFAALIYPAWLAQKDDLTKLNPELVVSEESPPMFFAHAADDRLSCMHSVTLFTALHQANVPAALNVFSGGGHGFGARTTGTADDHWPVAMEAWMRDEGWIGQ